MRTSAGDPASEAAGGQSPHVAPHGTARLRVAHEDAERRQVIDAIDHLHEALPDDVPGLFVVDGSTVRGPIGVNPQLTIMATATRAAERIAERIG